MTAAAPPRAEQSTAHQHHRLSGILLRIRITDLLVIIWAVLGAMIIRFGSAAAATPELEYITFIAMLVATWVLMLHLHDAYDRRLLGHGPEEYKVVAKASFQLFAVLAILSYLLRLEVARGFVAIAMPAGMLGLLLSRWLWRKWLTMHRIQGLLSTHRIQGLLSTSVLVVGEREHLVNLIRSLESVPDAGYRVVAACCSDAEGDYLGRVPVLGDESQAAEIARRADVSTVICTSSQRLGSGGLRRLGWALEGQDVDLVVAPELTEVAGPRVLTRPVAGLSLLHVEAPVFAGPQLAIKTTIDRIAAATLLVLLSPLFAVVAILIRRDAHGPVFFRQERVGKGGTFFPMLKFRTMVIDAEEMLPSLLDQSDGQGPLFKLRDDPRITNIGATLRRYSLDELPQLVNVLRGDMSLVGPRPPLASEVEEYEHDVRRRLLVRPGMTGLWQINGRSDLSWEEAVRFDLYYVENWSVMSDLMILWRTGRAVVQSSGAYEARPVMNKPHRASSKSEAERGWIVQ
jgi:exopolysaccharide biosynthesis polyprenyl glycosylphosphotransferase